MFFTEPVKSWVKKVLPDMSTTTLIVALFDIVSVTNTIALAQLGNYDSWIHGYVYVYFKNIYKYTMCNNSMAKRRLF